MSAAKPGTQMCAEMAEQPRVLAALVARSDAIMGQVGAVLPDPLRGVVIVARGSSDNAAVHGRYVLEMAGRVPVALAAPSLQTRYGVTPRLGGFVVIGISHSGETSEVVESVQRLGAHASATIAITNVAGSPLAEVADTTVLLNSGDERAVPATKTFTAQTLALVLMAQALGPLPGVGATAMSKLLDTVAAVLDDDRAIDTAVGRLLSCSRTVVGGRGLVYAAALEVGLKLVETTGREVRATSNADLLHGPIAAVDASTCVMCLTTDDTVDLDVARVADESRARGASVVTVGADCFVDGVINVPVPGGVAAPLAAIPLVVRGQQLAHAVSIALGIDPDVPFDLSKVTQT